MPTGEPVPPAPTVERMQGRKAVDGLLPSDAPVGWESVDRQLPACARHWGRFLDTRNLLPGDLILTRSIDPDGVAKRIVAGQESGGLAARHAQWTHAAVYLGDGEHICESSFKEVGFRWGVNVRSLFDYCDSRHAIRARRPLVRDDRQRMRIAIGAMARIGEKYSFMSVFDLWREANRGRFWFPGQKARRLPSRAVVCSTLYQDAYTFSFQGLRIVHGHLATPAHLSASTDFEPVDPQLAWLGIL